MPNILDAWNVGALHQYLVDRPLLAFDFDGTLAPIVEDPEKASMSDITHQLFKQVASLYPTVVVSGRSRSDCQRRTSDVPLIDCIGNHGLERGGDNDPPPPYIHEWREQLEEGLAGAPGIAIEDKGVTLTIHYRKAPERSSVRSAIDRAVRHLTPHPRIVPGKLCVNLLPAIGAHKGTAVVDTMRAIGVSRAIYVGDDQTDEDAFALAPFTDVLTIRVGCVKDTRAMYHVGKQSDVTRLLFRILQFSAQQQHDVQA